MLSFQWDSEKITSGHTIGCNAVSWAPFNPSGVKRFVSGGCDNLVKVHESSRFTNKKVQGLEEHGLTAGPKPLWKESGIHHRLQNCYAFLLAKGVQALQMFEIMEISAFSTNALSRFAIVIVDGVLGHPRLAQHTLRCSCTSSVLEEMHEAS